jgi:hypothetical protein
MFLLVLILSLSYIQSLLNFEQQILLSPEFDKRQTNIKYSDELYAISNIIIENKYYLLQKNNELYRLYIPEEILPKRSYLLDFCIFDNEIYLLDAEMIVYKFTTSGNSYNYTNYYLLPDIFTYIYVDNNSITCLNDMIAGSNKNDSSQTYVYKIEKKTGNDSFKYFKNPIGMAFTLLKPRKLIDYNDGITIVSDALNYRILFYDNEYKLIDSIKREPENWLKTTNIKLKQNVKQSFNELIESYKKHSLVEKVYFIDSQQILVSWTSPDNEKLITYFDLWEKKDKKWTLKFKDLTSIVNDTNHKFSPNNTSITGSFTISNNKLLQIEPFPLEIKESYLKKSVIQIDSLIEDYFYENDLRYSVFVRSFK